MGKNVVVTTSMGEVTVMKAKNDVNGNSRYVVHFLALGLNDYDSVKGLEKYRGKDFGGGYVFQSVNLQHDLEWMMEKAKEHNDKHYKKVDVPTITFDTIDEVASKNDWNVIASFPLPNPKDHYLRYAVVKRSSGDYATALYNDSQKSFAYGHYDLSLEDAMRDVYKRLADC